MAAASQMRDAAAPESVAVTQPQLPVLGLRVPARRVMALLQLQRCRAWSSAAGEEGWQESLSASASSFLQPSGARAGQTQSVLASVGKFPGLTGACCTAGSYRTKADRPTATLTKIILILTTITSTCFAVCKGAILSRLPAVADSDDPMLEPTEVLSSPLHGRQVSGPGQPCGTQRQQRPTSLVSCPGLLWPALK